MSVWLPVAPCTPPACAGHPGRPAPLPLALLRLAAAAAVLLAGVAGAPAARRLPGRLRHRAVRAWCRLLVRAFGIRIDAAGGPGPRGGRLVVANHVSWLDVPLIAAVLPARMLAKGEIGRWPVLGPLAASAGTLFIDRDRIRALPGTVATLAGALRAGDRVAVFPEGSTWCGRDQGPFRHAAFQAALDAGVPVQPVRLAYRLPDGSTAGAPAFVGDDPLTASLWRIARARGVTAEIRLLPRIPAGRHPDRRTLARAAQAAVASDSANRPASSVHHRVSSRPAAASSVRTPS
ncbi:1-acyl-sn-glycerol-3-phosphate acyltransferase [Streptomyces bambusae]|uniref:lysophospholipid acyltransferase family protein n=1 Tax=Streptomyces bambusae TaxID=1550616 RepID=UPI001CFD677F|nr:lysophospholipid acyltransferase family protein [Streptomyces bambusae]MCB5164315.1 1-acyl-sn-glycerol-3-phosphate acyltransferase [Streptomyces bambusae]